MSYADVLSAAMGAAALAMPPGRARGIRTRSRWTPYVEQRLAKERAKQKRRAKNRAARKARKANR